MALYLLIGTHLPEVRQCIRSLHEAGAAPSSTVFWPEGLPTGEPLDGITVSLYTGCLHLPQEALLNDGTLFVFIDPRRPLIRELHELAGLLVSLNREPTRILTCVDTQRASESTALRTWLEAAIYHSDAVLLGNRAQTAKSFLRDYQLGFQKRCFPCIFQLLKGPGIPENPSALLERDTRRLTLIFDLPEPHPATLPSVIIEASCDLDNDEAEPDPYLSPEGDFLQLPEIVAHLVTETP